MFPKKEIIEICHRIYERGMTAATDGNVSVLLSDDTLLITASGTCLGEIAPETIIHTDRNGKPLFTSMKPSTEIGLHTYIYNSRNDVNAVVHCHPVYATAFAAARVNIDLPIFPEVILTIGRIPLCNYANPSTTALADSLKEHITYCNVFLLANHGAIAVGKNLKEAYFRMEKLEHAAKIIHHSQSLGGAKSLTGEQLDELYQLAETTYNIKLHDKNKY